MPRLARWDMAAEGQARRAYEELLEGSARATEPGGPWAERLALLAQLGRALERRDVARTDHLFSQVLLHRGAFRVATLKDLPYMVVLLERLYEGTQPRTSSPRRSSTSVGRSLRSMRAGSAGLYFNRGGRSKSIVEAGTRASKRSGRWSSAWARRTRWPSSATCAVVRRAEGRES